MMEESQVKLQLKEFVVFSSLYGDKEGEEEKKILFFYPPTPLNDQLYSLGLYECMLNFTKSFSSNCRVLHTKKFKSYFHELHPGYFAVISVEVVPISQASDKYNPNHLIDDNVMKSVLLRICNTFQNYQLNELKDRLNHFLTRYLLVLDLQNADLLDCLTGLPYAVANQEDFLSCLCLVNQMCYDLARITHVGIFYVGHLLWSSLPASTLSLLYRFLISRVFDDPPDSDTLTGQYAGAVGAVSGRFLSFSNDDRKCTQVFLPNDNTAELQPTSLVAYRSLKLVICMFVEGTKPIPDSFYSTFEERYGNQWIHLANSISIHLYHAQGSNAVKSTESQNIVNAVNDPNFDQLSAFNGDEPPFSVKWPPATSANSHFIYYNPEHLSVMTTMHVDRIAEDSILQSIPKLRPYVFLLSEMRNELLLNQSDWHMEVVHCISDAHYLVLKRSNKRLFFIVLPQYKDGIKRLTIDLARMNKIYFKDLLLLD